MCSKGKFIEEGEEKYHLRISRLENAVVAFFYEGAMRLGTLAFSLPKPKNAWPTTSSVLIGGKYMVTSRFLAERLAAKTNKMSLVSVYTTLPEKKALRIFSKLLDESLNKRTPKTKY